MQLFLRRLIPALALCAVATTAVSARAATPPARVVYAAEVPQRSDVRDLGRLAPAARIGAVVSLAYRNESELEALVRAQGDASSPLYEHFLTSAQFAAYFAPSQADYARTLAALQRAGFGVRATFPNRTLIDVVAPAAVVERYFHTQIHRVAQAGVGLRYTNALPALLPRELSGIVESVELNDLVVARPAFAFPSAVGRAAARLRALTSSAPEFASPQVIGGALFAPDGGYGPLATAKGYDLPVQHGYSGTGRATGVAISGDFSEADLKKYLAFFKITRTGAATTRVEVDGGAPYSPVFSFSNPSIEATLDVETIVGNAPGTHLYMYLFPDLSSQSIEDGYNRAVSDNHVDALNSSFGGCETADTSFATTTQKIALQGAAKGITFAASSGDDGANMCGSNFNVRGVSAPASGTSFVAVGGTTYNVTSTGSYSSEQAWDGSGGGFSKIFAVPAYQKGLSGASTSGRSVPDVAFAADPNTGTGFYFGTGGSAAGWDGPVGGTSWSSPLYCALVTEIDQFKKARAGDPHTKLYAAFKKFGYGDFHDVTSGNNGGYSAKTGFDLVTGIGSFKADTFMKNE